MKSKSWIWLLAIPGAIVIEYLLGASIINLIEQHRVLYETRIVRIHIAVALSLLFVVGGHLFLNVNRGNLRLKLLLAILLGALAILEVILLFSPQDFMREESQITYFTSLVLAMAALAAGCNYCYLAYVATRSTFVVRMFWLAMTFAFFFASADESLTIHEAIGARLDRYLGADGAARYMQDIVTLLYSAAGLVVVFLSLTFLRKEFVKRGCYFWIIFIFAAVCYAASTLLDSFDDYLQRFGSLTNLDYMANSCEEVLEFVAANLFLTGFVIALLETDDHRLLKQAVALLGDTRSSGRRLKAVFYGLAGPYLLALVVVGVLYWPPAETYVREPDRFAVTVRSKSVDGSESPDGMFMRGGKLYVASDLAASVFVFDDRESPPRRIVGVPGDFERLESITVGPSGTIYVSDDSKNLVFAIDGNESRVILRPADGIRSPKGLAMDSKGNLLVADAEVGTVFKYQAGKLHIHVSSLDGLTSPEELAVDRFDNLYVTDEHRHLVLRTAPSGETTVFVDEKSGLRAPEGIAIHGDDVFVTDSKRGAVFRFNLQGENPQGEGRVYVQLTNRMRQVEGIAVDADGTLFLGIRKPYPMPCFILEIRAR